jgi:hypothetical protein
MVRVGENSLLKDVTALNGIAVFDSGYYAKKTNISNEGL